MPADEILASGGPASAIAPPNHRPSRASTAASTEILAYSGAPKRGTP